MVAASASPGLGRIHRPPPGFAAIDLGSPLRPSSQSDYHHPFSTNSSSKINQPLNMPIDCSFKGKQIGLKATSTNLSAAPDSSRGTSMALPPMPWQRMTGAVFITLMPPATTNRDQPQKPYAAHQDGAVTLSVRELNPGHPRDKRVY
ncbi:hypothetical protein PCASD_00337 [Puccinia coronata f. sp. avenae]|uniref:Uncharacterized protein n=1 Tax=Puccinia coronata f. sp. avenae TaxID=200324 RepID=A0A2N5VNG3_9BASI|nr:hypothetical protein PCASD_00337 [Puccinia coronata f. sp. avenae]